MYNKLICAKVNSMLSLYLDGKLSPVQEEFVKQHLSQCGNCLEKYNNLKKLLDVLQVSYLQSNAQKVDTVLKINEYEYYQQNLSAYFDNELSFDESVRLKHYIVKIPFARQELQKMYNLQKLMQKNCSYIKKKMNQDFSKNIINKFYTNRKYLYTEYFSRIVAVVFVFFLLSSFFGAYYYVKYIDGGSKIVQAMLGVLA